MDQSTSRLIALFLLGSTLFNYPLLSLFNWPQLILGVPLLYGYLFLIWVLVIVLAGLTAEFNSS